MSLIPENPSKGDTFTNPETAVEYTFDGVKWLASGAEDDGATSEEKIALIESQIQYRGLMDVDADGKPIWPADQTKDRGGWWAYPSSKFSSIWNYDKLEWIFPFAGEAGDITKRSAPEYKVGDIIQLQISDNEAGSGTGWQYFDTAPVYVEYKVEEVYYPDTQAGNENKYHPAYRVSMSNPIHRYSGGLPNVVKGPQGDPSDAWIQWYPTVFAYGAAVIDDRYLKLSGGTMENSAQLGINYLKPVNLKHIQYECDPTATHPEALVNLAMVQAMIKAESGGDQAALPEWTLAHFTFGEMQPGKMAFCDGNANGTDRLENARGVVFSATDANGNRVGRTKDGVDWQRDFGGALNILYDEEKTLLSMARSHGSAPAVIYYMAEIDAYTIIWPADKDAVVTSNITHVVLNQSYKIHCPDIIF